MQFKQLLERSFPNKLDITGEIAESGAFEVLLPDLGIVLHSKKNGAGYVDTNEKVKAICEGIKTHLRKKSPKVSNGAKEPLTQEEQGQPSSKPELKPRVEGPLVPEAEKKPELKPSTEGPLVPEAEKKPELKPSTEGPLVPEAEKKPELKPSTEGPLVLEAERKPEPTTLTKKRNDLNTATPRY
ncbi:IgA FC receptor-like [Candoia aspera]|uniref:IgA FC receptor-like n=1 Tax=Candoia aspera TaxID=51853 RepID=UPI002FD8715D